MLAFIVQRCLLALLTMWVISVLSFVIIQLPPGDFVSTYIAMQSASGSSVSAEEAEYLRELYGLNSPFYVQYAKWMGRILAGDFGVSMEWNRPVTEVIGDRLWLTFLISFAALIVTWGLALPIGIYSAVRQYSIADYIFTLVGFVGLAVPNFLLALVIMYLAFRFLGANVGGLFSTEFEVAPWSWAKAWDLLKHLPLPAVILALAGTAQLIRIMRANLLDELSRPYVVTARAKGLKESRVILKYPVRAALNPFASTIAYLFPNLVSGSVIISIVLSLPTVGR
jgi:peptide/nickel transport system permease protein